MILLPTAPTSEFLGAKPQPASVAKAPGASTGTTGPVVAASAPGEVVKPAKEREPYVAPKDVDFAFRRLEIDTSGERPEACLVFTREFKTDGSVRYEDYLAFDPQVQFAVRATNDRLCIAGLAYNDAYTLTLRAGLPAATGEKLAEPETVRVELRDQPSKVAFGPGFILPRDSADGVPLTTVNVDTVMVDGRIVHSGGPELALKLEEKGYDWARNELAAAA